MLILDWIGLKILGAWARFGGLCPLGPNLQPLMQVRLPPGPLSSNALEQAIYTGGAQANSAFHPSGVGN